MRVVTATALGMILCTAGLVQAQPQRLPVANGDFEVGVDPGATLTRLLPGQTNITGWTVLPAAVDYVGGYWQASSGSRFVDLDGNFGEAGGIAQLVATVPGQEYVVEFDMAGLPIPGPPDIKRLRVRAAGQSADYEFSVVGRWAEDMGWERNTFTFTATATTALLEFISTTDPPGNGPAVDNINADPPVHVQPTTWGRIKALFAGSVGL